MLMMASWSFYAVSLFLRLDGTRLGQPGMVAVAMSVAGLVVLCIGGWLGGKLVYEYGVGTRSSRNAMEGSDGQRPSNRLHAWGVSEMAGVMSAHSMHHMH